MVTFGRRGRTRNQYLHFYVGQPPSNLSGLRLIRNATIISLSGQLNASGTCNFRIRKNDVATNLATLALSGVTGAGDDTINLDLTAGDFLQSYLDAAANVRTPVMMVEIAWRA
jgi:hypothetical protein